MIMAGGLVMLIGTAILTSSTTIAQLLVRRIVTGIVNISSIRSQSRQFLQGNGFNSSTIPIYQSETSPANVRGILVCLQSSTTIVGLAIAYR